MSDIEEHPMHQQQDQTTNSTSVIRYSKDVLLSLHDSPLVSKPDTMPSLSSWFSEETGSPAVSKNILNGSTSTKSSDKSIILGPPKTNFASSLYGGLKHTTDTNASKLSSSSRLRQSEDSTRIHNNNRMPRGPNYVGEKGFHHYHYNNNSNGTRQEKSGLERRTSNSYGSSHNNNKRYNHSDHHAERQSINGGRREFNREQRPNNRLGQTEERNQERVPEWMDYNPDAKKVVDEQQPGEGEFANDLEAWKSSMKKKEGLPETIEKQSPPSVQDHPPQTNEKQNDAMDKILGLGSLDLNSTTFFDSTPSSDLPTKRGSRFAKFFAKREEAAQVIPATQDSQPRSISVNDLFGNSTNQVPPPPPPMRMLSEEDVLQSIGAKKTISPTSEQQPIDSDKNAIGFNKVLQILSQSKPTVPPDTSDQEKTMDTSNGVITDSVKETPPNETTLPPPNKKVSNLFGNNLPTSVLRQMSARSEGRSPSKSNNHRFSSHSATNSQNGSPLIANASPVHIQQQSPSNYGYQQGYPLRTYPPYPPPPDMEEMMLMNPNYDMMYGSDTRPPTMNRIMSPKFTPQQFMNPPPPPPPPQMMGMPGAHPMMSPHMSMRGGNVPPPFMQQPLMPGMPPPPPNMGMSQQQQQQMYTNKNHGWNRQ
ncbi:hypothetical protein BC941DRAFT_432678 [Chlamydoabsidia padenii]|nr:hypothetical protein BC941DRAFT_432678 [Chlamydoabsidia padenii]